MPRSRTPAPWAAQASPWRFKILNGELPVTPADEASRMVTVDPVVWENVTPEGLEQVKAAADPDLDNEWPVLISIPDWTTYNKDQILACKGPGE